MAATPTLESVVDAISILRQPQRVLVCNAADAPAFEAAVEKAAGTDYLRVQPSPHCSKGRAFVVLAVVEVKP